jgi:hypothetical protein
MATQNAAPSAVTPEAPQSANSASENQSAWSPPTKWTALRKFGTKYNPWIAIKKYHQKPKEIPQKEPPFSLSLWGVLLLLCYELLIITTIAIIWILSTKNDGLINVPDTPSSVDGFNGIHGAFLWTYALLWTFLPTFVVSMCGKLFSKTLQVLEECQPTIELRKYSTHSTNPSSGNGDKAGLTLLPSCQKDVGSNRRQEVSKKSTAKLTVLLDYGNYWFPLIDTFYAFRNKHFIIGVCMIIKWSFVGIGPLASGIISVGNVASSTDIKVTSSTFFDDWKNQTSSRAAFEAASSMLLNGGGSLPWTTNTSSVVPFYAQSNVSGNLTAETGVYSASLDCRTVDVDSLIRAGNITQEVHVDVNITTFSFTDRECSVDLGIVVSQSTSLYSKTSFAPCHFEDDQARLAFLTGQYDERSSEFQLSNFSLISCIPSFWNTTSRVSVVSGVDTPSKYGQITNIHPMSPPKRFWPQLWHLWMSSIPGYSIHDPTLATDSDDFGRVAYGYATQSAGAEMVDFVKSVNTTFSVLYAAFATTSTYSPLPENHTFMGTLARPQNRLFVVFYPAIIVTSVMAIAVMVTVWLAIYAYSNRLILGQHLDLILGHAILLEGNKGVGKFINAVKEDAGENADLVQHAKEVPDLNGWHCWVGDEGKLHMEKPEPEPVASKINQPNAMNRASTI